MKADIQQQLKQLSQSAKAQRQAAEAAAESQRAQQRATQRDEIAFAAAVLLTGWGLWRMNIDQWQKYYMLVTWLFMVSSSFTLAKTIRDAQEADLLEQRSARARSGEADAA